MENDLDPFVRNEVPNNGGYYRKKNSCKKIIIFVFSMVMAFAMGIVAVLVFFHFFPDYISKPVTNVNKLEKEVTVTDVGIADAVEKIYDAVVIVKNYKNNQLYSTGTGFIYKKDKNMYYLLTNYHVIQNGNSVKVVLTNNEEIETSVVGGDLFADIAVLSFESTDELLVSKISTSNDMRVGDTVFAIGAPLDSNVYSWSVTRGILSGKRRKVNVKVVSSTIDDWVMEVLQTDAAINSGNSGGPLCNSNGEVVGITNMKLVTEGVEGMGFAIPIEDATLLGDKIINGEDISRPCLGIGMYDAGSSKFGGYYTSSQVNYGVVVTKIYDSSPAYEAGLRQGDVIIGINDTDVTNVATLRVQLYKYQLNTEVNIKYLRDNKVGIAKVMLSKCTDS